MHFERESDREAHEFLRRAVLALEDIAQSLRSLRQPAAVRSIDLMALPTGPIPPGTTDTFTASAVDAAGNVVPSAVPAVTSSDESVLTLTSDGAPGTSTITYTALADGTATVTGSFTNPDGTTASTGAGNPDAFTVATPVPDVAAVNFAQFGAMGAIAETVSVPLGSLKPYPSNPRNGDIELIADSLRHHGQYRALVVQRSTMRVLAGNHTLHALHETGAAEALVHMLDVDDEEAARINLVDNRANDVAKYDEGLLAELLQSLPSLEGTGFDDRALDDLLTRLAQGNPIQGDPDEIPDPPEKPITEPGDLWLLGEHRLLCGDSRSAQGVSEALTGPVDLLLMDPPYGVSIGAKNRALDEIDRADRRKEDLAGDDGMVAAEELWRASFPVIAGMLPAGKPFYVFGPCAYADPLLLLLLLREAGIPAKHVLVWRKNRASFGMERLDYDYAHELIGYGWKPGAAHPWFAAETQTTVLEYDRPQASPDHATAKPVELLSRLIENSAPPGGWVFDPFAGSGSTLIAAHALGRRSVAIEIEPRYCDVILARFENATGVAPIKAP